MLVVELVIAQVKSQVNSGRSTWIIKSATRRVHHHFQVQRLESVLLHQST